MNYSSLAGLLLLVFSSMALADSGLTIKLHSLTNASPEVTTKVNQALNLIEGVVNTPTFRDRVLNMTYKIGSKTYAGYTQTEMTPTQVLQDIDKAEENFAGGTDGVIDLFLDSYYERSSTIGYTSPSDKYIHMNQYIQGSYTVAQTAGNIFHEWLHKVGYGHSRRHNSYRPHSVPYKLGYMLAEMVASKMAGKNQKLKAEIVDSMNSAVSLCNH